MIEEYRNYYIVGEMVFNREYEILEKEVGIERVIDYLCDEILGVFGYDKYIQEHSGKGQMGLKYGHDWADRVRLGVNTIDYLTPTMMQDRLERVDRLTGDYFAEFYSVKLDVYDLEEMETCSKLLNMNLF